ncbi:hypothetical protein JY651_01820 [Pyxidicoccus parkwayensis]|uniref:Uncharacterized protein n=1 Tax=Pyxidicoccus parkwayensis TaxID=2813578 RepID=A0ABX7NY73_9BACT|nr:hypothetical protein [Pyxidicoccus parkwaysis]QSQ23750.1 hypothetical protein JY651_01820 [Pyxidicoccus parkwaysis]
MLRIRREQLDALGLARREAFIDRLAEKLRRHWASECEGLDAPALRERIGDAIDRAAKYELRAEVDVARYLNITFALGPRFDEDPRYPWARAILEEEAFTPAKKVDRLCALTAEALTKKEA